jgi:hypothetical protein
MVKFIQQGTTITSEMFCAMLKKPCRVIQNKRHGMLTSGVVLLHNSACLHTASRTQTLLEPFKWELSEQPPYSPDLSK